MIAQAEGILAEIAVPDVNMDEMKLQKVPRLAVYAPKTILPWDDAVTMALTYAEIPYDIIYDDEEEDIEQTSLYEDDSWLYD